MNTLDPVAGKIDDKHVKALVEQVENKFSASGINGKSINVYTGPVVTTIEYQPNSGTNLNIITDLKEELARALKVKTIRMVIPIPGKKAIGIEIPNPERDPICFRQIQVSDTNKKPLSLFNICLGLDTAGMPLYSSLDEISHLIIAGEDAAEKQMGLNVLISNILFRATPEEVRMLIIDSENIAMHVFNGIPHLVAPVITDDSEAVNALSFAVKEMERRNDLLMKSGAKTILEYNEITNAQSEKLTHLIIIVNELADLMAVNCQETEMAVARLAEAETICGIHVILATQRPSVDVVPGMFKARFPTRISFHMPSQIYSWTVLDSLDAQALTGEGDMLVWASETPYLSRIHGAFITDTELKQLIEFWQKQKGLQKDDIVFSIAEADESV